MTSGSLHCYSPIWCLHHGNSFPWPREVYTVIAPYDVYMMETVFHDSALHCLPIWHLHDGNSFPWPQEVYTVIAPYDIYMMVIVFHDLVKATLLAPYDVYMMETVFHDSALHCLPIWHLHDGNSFPWPWEVYTVIAPYDVYLMDIVFHDRTKSTLL